MTFSKFLDPKNDISFKRIFGTEKNKDILIHFLNDILGFTGKNEISDDLARRFKYFDDNNSVFNALFAKMSSWMKDKRGRFLTPEEGKEFFQKVELWASTVSEIRQGVERIEGKVDEIGEVLNNQQARKEPIWFNMMEPVASFTGRNSELEALHDALQKSTGKQAVISQVASISGLGGVGKSIRVKLRSCKQV